MKILTFFKPTIIQFHSDVSIRYLYNLLILTSLWDRIKVGLDNVKLGF